MVERNNGYMNTHVPTCVIGYRTEPSSTYYSTKKLIRNLPNLDPIGRFSPRIAEESLLCVDLMVVEPRVWEHPLLVYLMQAGFGIRHY